MDFKRRSFVYTDASRANVIYTIDALLSHLKQISPEEAERTLPRNLNRMISWLRENMKNHEFLKDIESGKLKTKEIHTMLIKEMEDVVK